MNAIVPMKAGELPTEPGWYVVRQGDASGMVCVYADRESGRLIVEIGESNNDPCVDAFANGTSLVIEGPHTFIARIYPERIEGEKT